MPTPTVAANAYAALARMRDDTAKVAGGLSSAPSGGLNFSAVLRTVMDNVTAAAQRSDAQAMAVANGKANMVDVVTAVAETETAVQTLVSVRDKVIAAYEEIMRMPI